MGGKYVFYCIGVTGLDSWSGYISNQPTIGAKPQDWLLS